MKSRLLVCGILLAVVSATTAAQQPVGGALRGRVLEQISGTPIANALVEFMDGRTRVRAKAITTPSGDFTMSNLPTGPFRLRVTRIGYVDTTTPYWRVQSGEVLTLIVRLDPQAVPLAPLEVSERARLAAPVLEGFLDRMNRNAGGTYFSRADIERTNPFLITDLLAGVPGVYLENAPALGRNAKVLSFARSPLASGGGACPAQVFVDGVLVTRRGFGPVSVDELATPATLEGIEIYKGLSSVPAELAAPDARCGVVALWTRRG